MKRLSDILFKSIFAVTLFWFFVGILVFPDAPIKSCGENSFCDKHGQIRTAEDFERYKGWRWGNAIFFPLAFVLLLVKSKFNKNS